MQVHSKFIKPDTANKQQRKNVSKGNEPNDDDGDDEVVDYIKISDFRYFFRLHGIRFRRYLHGSLDSKRSPTKNNYEIQ